MALFIINPVNGQTIATWHVGEPVPEKLITMRVITFQADGDELEAIQSAMIQSLSPAASETTLPVLEQAIRDVCDGDTQNAISDRYRELDEGLVRTVRTFRTCNKTARCCFQKDCDCDYSRLEETIK